MKIFNEKIKNFRRFAPGEQENTSFTIKNPRAKRAEKRGGGLVRVELRDEDAAVETQAEQLLLIDESLRELAKNSDRLVKVFECKFFAGLDDDETAATLKLSKRTAQRDWMKARALLADYLSKRA